MKSIKWDSTNEPTFPRSSQPNKASPSQQIKGQVELFSTDSEPQEVIVVRRFKQADYARTGNKATRMVILPVRPVMWVHTDLPESFPHNEESPAAPEAGSMKRGVLTLENTHRVCVK